MSQAQNDFQMEPMSQHRVFSIRDGAEDIEALNEVIAEEGLADIPADHNSSKDGFTSAKQSMNLDEDLDYKIKYRKIKHEFRLILENHEYLEQELRTQQRALQTLQEDRYFLLDRLLLYEKPADSPEESNEGSDSETEPSVAKKGKNSVGEVRIASAFSKMKSLSSGRKNKRTKAKCPEELLESPSDSLGTFDEAGLTPTSFTYPNQEESD